MRDGVYLARYQGSPAIKLTTKASAIFIYHRHFHFRYQPHNIESYITKFKLIVLYLPWFPDDATDWISDKVQNAN